MLAIKLARIGGDAVVSVICGRAEAVVIRERYDGAFCHIVEPDAIAAALGREAKGAFACPICGEATPHNHSQFEVRRHRQKQEEGNG